MSGDFRLSVDDGMDFIAQRQGNEITLTVSIMNGFVVQAVTIPVDKAADLACWLVVACTGGSRA